MGTAERHRLRSRRRRLRRSAAASVGFVALGALAFALVGGGRGRTIVAPPALHHVARTRAIVLHRHGHRSSPQARALARLLRLGLPVYCGGSHGHLVALTFDDGPGPYTSLALRILHRAHARATFFLVGKELAFFPGMPLLEAELGPLGDHTWTHPLLTRLPSLRIHSELSRTKRAIDAVGHTHVLLFRPPYGAHDRTVDDAARALGLVQVLWSLDTRDSEGARWSQIAASVAGQIRGGAIVLMHENRGQSIRALKYRILPMLRARHLKTVTVPELLAADPPSLAQLRRGLNGCLGGGPPLSRAA